MRLGDNRWHYHYVCDKCGRHIQYIAQKGLVGINHYYKGSQAATVKRSFDLCAGCEKLFRKWLKQKEVETPQDIINRFPEWEDE